MNKAPRVLFIGSKQLGLRVLDEMCSLAPEALIGAVTLDDRDDTRTAFAAFQELAARRRLPLQVAKNRRHSEQLMVEFQPDLCFVVGWFWLIGAHVLRAVPRGFIGVHNSILPKYRGGAPLIWAILNGEREVGFSLFTFSEGMDDGPVWAIGRVPVTASDHIGDVLCKLEDEAVTVMRARYLDILGSRITPVEQDHAAATYAALRIPSDGAIDWNRPAAYVYDFVRAQSEPYPGAFTYLEGTKLTIWRARTDPATWFGTPGQVARLEPTGVHIVCGDRKVVVLETVELNGVRAQAAEVIKSVKVRFPRVPIETNRS